MAHNLAVPTSNVPTQCVAFCQETISRLEAEEMARRQAELVAQREAAPAAEAASTRAVDAAVPARPPGGDRESAVQQMREDALAEHGLTYPLEPSSDR